MVLSLSKVFLDPDRGAGDFPGNLIGYSSAKDTSRKIFIISDQQFLRDVASCQTDRQTDRQTNAG